MQGGGGERDGFREINVTPLVDVMLVLLVVFMITAPLLETGLRVELPVAAVEPLPVEEEVRVLAVDQDGHVWLGERDITRDVAGALASDEALQRTKELYLRGDHRASYGAVARVIAAAKAAGIDGVSLLIEPAEEGRALDR